MGIVLKTPEEIEAMRVAGHLAGEVLKMIREHVVVGITTGELDTICHDYITGVQQAIPAPLNYRGFPKSICTSINQVVCHGIPGDKKLKNGDILNIDITVIKDGWHGDSSRMFDAIHCWPSSRCPAGMKNSIGRSIRTACPPMRPSTSALRVSGWSREGLCSVPSMVRVTLATP